MTQISSLEGSGISLPAVPSKLLEKGFDQQNPFELKGNNLRRDIARVKRIFQVCLP